MMNDYIETFADETDPREGSIEDYAIVVIKPSGEDLFLESPLGNGDKFSVSTLLLGMLESADLTILRSNTKQLTEEDIYNIYPILSIPDERYGEAWKTEVVEHMTSQPVSSYLVFGEEASLKARLIKNYFRKVLLKDSNYQSKIVKNLAHVVDDDDFLTSFKVLFN